MKEKEFEHIKDLVLKQHCEIETYALRALVRFADKKSKQSKKLEKEILKLKGIIAAVQQDENPRG